MDTSQNKNSQIIVVLGAISLFGTWIILRRRSYLKRLQIEAIKREEQKTAFERYSPLRLMEESNIIAQIGLKAPRICHHPKYEAILSPLYGEGKGTDVNRGDEFLPEPVFNISGGYVLAQSYFPDGGEINMSKALRFVRGAPRKQIIMPPEAVKAAIITCGGLCPGLNAVIRDLVMTLFYNYGVKEIYGVKSGYKGFYTPNSYKKLSPLEVQDIHELGGTIIKSSRGGWDLKRIADGIEEAGFNQLYILGGDGTHRGIKELVKEFERRGTPIWISGISKTIDNDIPVIDKSFGFETSVEEAQRAINSANVEANSVDYGIGLVKLMGRNSGFIAMHATIANGNVNICLVPEWKYELHGEKGVLAHILRRLKHKNHCVIVVAEGAASACIDEKLESQGTDPSGNPILYDIGSYLKKEIVKYCQANGVDATLKYIDPTYMIRTVQANSHDKILCTTLAMAAVHGTFAGFTGFSVGLVAGQPVYIPVEVLTTVQEGIGSKPGQRTIDTEKNPNWWRLIASTGQPSFRN